MSESTAATFDDVLRFHPTCLRQEGKHAADDVEANLLLGEEALKSLGIHPFKVRKMAQAFRRHDRSGLDELYHLWDENPDIARNKALLARAQARRATLKDVMEADCLQLHDRTERGWTPPPKGYNEDLG